MRELVEDELRRSLLSEHPSTGFTPQSFMIWVGSILGAFALALALFLGFSQTFLVDATDVAADLDGQALYLKTCAACHGPEAKGVPGLGKDMTTSEFVSGLSDSDLVAFIRKGRGVDDPANTTKVPMPPSGGNPALSDDELSAIVKFIRSR